MKVFRVPVSVLAILAVLVLLAPFTEVQGQPASIATFFTPVKFRAAAQTYYVAPSSLATCTYNGDGGQSCTPSDSNTCLTKALPCATLAGVQALISNMIIDHVVTIQLADTTGGTCYQPNGVTFDNPAIGGEKFDLFEFSTGIGYTDVYPTGYIWIHGHDGSVGSVNLVGATTCAGTTGTNRTALRFVKTNARISGVTFLYFDNTTVGQFLGNIVCIDHATCNLENSNFTAEDSSSSEEVALMCSYASTCHLGGSFTLSGIGMVMADLFSYVGGHTPAGFITMTMTAANWNVSVFTSNEKSHIVLWGAYTLTFNGTAAYQGFDADGTNNSMSLNSGIGGIGHVTFNNPNMTYIEAGVGSSITEACGSSENVCTSTSGPAIYALANLGSQIYIATASVSGGTLNIQNGGCILIPGTLNMCGDNINAANYRLLGVKGISATTTPAKNMDGSCTFSSATTCAVSFGTSENDSSYRITLGCNNNKTFWVTAKGTGGFTINASATSSDVCDWHLFR